MNATILSALADSGLHLVGNKAVQVEAFQPIPMGEDEDSHVAVFEEWDQRCMCCCCTGECRDQGYDEPSFEDVLSAGFVEGDFEDDRACTCAEVRDGWSSCEDCLPGCRNFMGGTSQFLSLKEVMFSA